MKRIFRILILSHNNQKRQLAAVSFDLSVFTEIFR